jgi:hypothetical protein
VARAVDVLSERVHGHLARESPVSDEAGWRAVMDEVLRASRAAVRKEAEARGVPVRELASTLLVVLLGPDVTVAVQVGDGAAVVRSGEGTLDMLARPQRGEYQNEVTFLTSSGAKASAQFAYRPGPVQAVACLTDGLELLAFEGPARAPFAPFFRPLFDFFTAQADAEAARTALEATLTDHRVRDRTEDDVTLVVTTRQPGAAPEVTEPRE